MTREEKTKKALARNRQRQALFRSSVDVHVSATMIDTFLAVAENPGLGVVELADRVGTTKATMSRYLLDLSERLRNGDAGYGLLKRIQDPKDLRSVAYDVTPKGKLLVNSLTDLEDD